MIADQLRGVRRRRRSARRRGRVVGVVDAAQLRLVQPPVGALARHQFVVRADLDDPAALQDDQAVGLAQGAQAVGDGDRRAALDQVVERLLDLPLGLGVDRRGRLVEDQDARVDQQRAGDRDPLPLAARERLAALADQRVVAVRQPEDELVRVRGARRGDDLRARRVGPAVGDVLGDRAEEQERLLQHDADVAAVVGHGEAADVDAVDQDRAVAHVVEAADQVDQRALARAAGADQADHLAGPDRQVEAADHRAVAVAEADAGQLDRALQRADRHRLRRLGHARDAVEDLEDALGAGRRPLRRRDHAAHRLEPGVEAADVGEEGGQDADGDLAAADQPGAEGPDDQQARRRSAGDTVGENRPRSCSSRSLAARTWRFASRKRCASRRSWANALTTRMPGIVSASTLVISAQARSIFSKPVRSRSRTRWTSQAMNGNGSKRRPAPATGRSRTGSPRSSAIISTSVAKSSACSDRKLQIRSVSEPMRAIRSPVRLPPKYSSESSLQVLVGRGAQVGGDPLGHQASSQVRAQPSTQASSAAASRPPSSSRDQPGVDAAGRSGTGSARRPSAGSSGRAAPASAAVATSVSTKPVEQFARGTAGRSASAAAAPRSTAAPRRPAGRAGTRRRRRAAARGSAGSAQFAGRRRSTGLQPLERRSTAAPAGWPPA